MILRIKITKTKYELALTKSNYLEKVPKKFNHFNDTWTPIPLYPNIKLVTKQVNSAIGSKMYAMYCTKPDIVYIVNR